MKVLNYVSELSKGLAMTTQAASTPVEVDDAVILLLGAPTNVPSLDGRIEGITRLEKLIFLLERETKLKDLLTESPNFQPHNFGPFSSKIYQAVETLAAATLIEESSEIVPSTEDSWESEEVVGTSLANPYIRRNFNLTPLGRRYYDALVSELPSDIERELRSFKQRFGSLPLRQLIRYAYRQYPEYTEKSLIKDQILGDPSGHRS